VVATDDAPTIVAGAGWVELDGELVVLDIEGLRVHLLSGTGALLFQLLDGQVTVGELAEDVADAFDLSPAVARKDIVEFVESMAAAGLLEPGSVDA
jgi:hypothetical protein